MGFSMFFGAKKKAAAKKRKSKAKKSPGRKPKGVVVRSLPKSQAYVMVRSKKGGLRKRKLHLGKNGALYYRTKSGRVYVKKSVLKKKGHVLSKSDKKRKSKKSKKAKKAKKSKFGMRRRRY